MREQKCEHPQARLLLSILNDTLWCTILSSYHHFCSYSSFSLSRIFAAFSSMNWHSKKVEGMSVRKFNKIYIEVIWWIYGGGILLNPCNSCARFLFLPHTYFCIFLHKYLSSYSSCFKHHLSHHHLYMLSSIQTCALNALKSELLTKPSCLLT